MKELLLVCQLNHGVQSHTARSGCEGLPQGTGGEGLALAAVLVSSSKEVRKKLIITNNYHYLITGSN